MRSRFSLVSIALSGVFAGMLGMLGSIGCSNHAARGADRAAVVDNAGPGDPANVCPDICGEGTPCRMPDGSCVEACNPCYCQREGGTVVDACPQAGAQQGALQAFASPTVAAGGCGRGRRYEYRM